MSRFVSAARVAARGLDICARNVRANQSRFRLSAISIFLGAFSLLVNLAILRGMDDELSTQLRKLGGAAMVSLVPLPAATAAEGLAFSKSSGLDAGELLELAQSHAFVRGILPEQALGWRSFYGLGRTAQMFVRAVGTAHPDAFDYQLLGGRRWTEAEARSSGFVCLMGIAGAERLFGDWRLALERSVIHGGAPFRVIGILDAGSRFELRSWEVLIPYQAYSGWSDSLPAASAEFRVLLDPGKDPNSAKAAIRETLLGLHRRVEDFRVVTNRETMEEIRASEAAIRSVIWCIAGLSMAIGGVCIMNIMFAGISDRLREIGTRKALGAGPWDIFFQFNFEAVAMAVIGGIPGLLAGAAMPFLLRGSLPFGFALLPVDFVAAAAFVAFTGLASGCLPAWRAAAMSPVEALAG